MKESTNTNHGTLCSIRTHYSIGDVVGTCKAWHDRIAQDYNSVVIADYMSIHGVLPYYRQFQGGGVTVIPGCWFPVRGVTDNSNFEVYVLALPVTIEGWHNITVLANTQLDQMSFANGYISMSPTAISTPTLRSIRKCLPTNKCLLIGHVIEKNGRVDCTFPFLPEPHSCLDYLYQSPLLHSSYENTICGSDITMMDAKDVKTRDAVRTIIGINPEHCVHDGAVLPKSPTYVDNVDLLSACVSADMIFKGGGAVSVETNEQNVRDYRKEILQAIKEKKEELKKSHGDGDKKIGKTIEQVVKQELDVLEKNNILYYFFLLMILIQIIKDKDVYVGAGRGSACSSLLCYLLGLTNINPLEYNLLFERFVNGKRIFSNPPDIDIDIPHDGYKNLITAVMYATGSDRVVYGSNFAKFTEKTIEDHEGIDASLVVGIPQRTYKHASSVIFSPPGRHPLRELPVKIEEQRCLYSADSLKTLGYFKIDLLSSRVCEELKNAIRELGPQYDEFLNQEGSTDKIINEFANGPYRWHPPLWINRDYGFY